MAVTSSHTRSTRFDGQGGSPSRERGVMFLLNKTNSDCVDVRKANGEDGSSEQEEPVARGALSVELFNRTCEEVNDWMSEKMMQIDTDEWSNDLKSFQALPDGKHNNRIMNNGELAPCRRKH
ncbi:Spectrin alpha chain, non-erythrocytic 1 [Orchesella cincta]|uniref:Spectrin alpha chain, non-erythrocytic 1 n=1 Tax=Orchesella cincta TaxID=48709 RepID=A0A1D2M1X2_ORCCI|nr:Spectrin alpha chain, non-erythrocytic 1 [Orchesella cincta]